MKRAPRVAPENLSLAGWCALISQGLLSRGKSWTLSVATLRKQQASSTTSLDNHASKAMSASGLSRRISASSAVTRAVFGSITQRNLRVLGRVATAVLRSTQEIGERVTATSNVDACIGVMSPAIMTGKWSRRTRSGISHALMLLFGSDMRTTSTLGTVVTPTTRDDWHSIRSARANQSADMPARVAQTRSGRLLKSLIRKWSLIVTRVTAVSAPKRSPDVIGRSITSFRCRRAACTPTPTFNWLTSNATV